ncbi:MAG: hypothetical protein ACRDOK_01585 [Streptosporangiaceae bacterium]
MPRAGTIRQRWEYGRYLVCDHTATTAAGNLRNGVLATLEQAARKAGRKFSRRDAQHRLRAAKAYPCESQIAQATSQYECWTDLVNAGFPPYPAADNERPYDPRTDSELASARGESGAGILPESFEQMALFARFTDDSTLAEMQRYATANAELTARFAERDERRQRYLDSLVKAVAGDLTKTWAEARAALAAQDGGEDGA